MTLRELAQRALIFVCHLSKKIEGILGSRDRDSLPREPELFRGQFQHEFSEAASAVRLTTWKMTAIHYLYQSKLFEAEGGSRTEQFIATESQISILEYSRAVVEKKH